MVLSMSVNSLTC